MSKSKSENRELDFLRTIIASGNGPFLATDVKKDPMWLVDVETSFYKSRSFTAEELAVMKERCAFSEPE